MQRIDDKVARPTRTYMLKLSPAGVELFAECHFRLCQLTNELLPYGQTLFAAAIHLRQLNPLFIADDLATLHRSGLVGSRECFVGAPNALAEIINAAAAQVAEQCSDHGRSVSLTHLFVIALKRFRAATSAEVMHSYRQMIAEAGTSLKISRTQRALIEK